MRTSSVLSGNVLTKERRNKCTAKSIFAAIIIDDEASDGSTPLCAPLEKQRKINGLQFHTGLRKAARSIDRTAFALYTLRMLSGNSRLFIAEMKAT